jgi:hypothetical protein
MTMSPLGIISFLNVLWLPPRLTCPRCKPNLLIGMGDDSILDVVNSVAALPWSSIYAMFDLAVVDYRPLIFEVISGNH